MKCHEHDSICQVEFPYPSATQSLSASPSRREDQKISKLQEIDKKMTKRGVKIFKKQFWLVVSTHLKNMLVKLDYETPSRDEHKQIFELPPPRIHSRRLVTSPCKAKVQLSFSSPPPQLTRIPGETFCMT